MKIAAYAPPKSNHTIDLKLDANEGRTPPDSLLASLASAGAESLRLYPSTRALEENIAERMDVDPDQVVVTNGGDDALDRICRAFLSPGQQTTVTSPTFEMIPRAARAIGADVIELPWLDGPFPTAAFVRSINAATGVTFIVTPNNPTGSVATAADIQTIARAAGDRPVCVDLAYTEYADVDLSPASLALSNVVTVRTFSKAWALAGLRIGYAVGPAALIREIRNSGGPYPVAGPSLALCKAWLSRGDSFVRESVTAVCAERAALTELLRSLGAHPIPSQANFVFARFTDAWAVAEQLAQRGIGVRRFPLHTSLSDFLRITCPCNPASFERLQLALRDILCTETAP